jgi:hypothetical protein
MSLEAQVAAWIAQARARLKTGRLSAADLDTLEEAVCAGKQSVRQRLLYLHATTPSLRSQVIGMALHEPVHGSITEIDTRGSEWPYATVHEALLDGWQVIHFPQQLAPFDDREIDVLGYEFILQKMEAYDA